MKEDKVSTGIILPIKIMERLDTMAHKDKRDRSAEIAFLVDEEWERRQPGVAISPRISERSLEPSA